MPNNTIKKQNEHAQIDTSNPRICKPQQNQADKIDKKKYSNVSKQVTRHMTIAISSSERKKNGQETAEKRCEPAIDSKKKPAKHQIRSI